VKNVAKQQNETLAAALLTPRKDSEEHVSARAARSWVRVKPENTDAIRKRLLVAHRVGVNSNGRRKSLRDYPSFIPSKTTTAAYIDDYLRLNARCNLSSWEFSHAHNVAPTYADGAVDYDPKLEEVEAAMSDGVADLV
jgi:hypothetical protein